MRYFKPASYDASGCLGPLLSVFLFLLLGDLAARADGVMVERTPLGHAAKMVASPRQEALLIRDGDRIRVTLRTSFRGGPKELAWIVPVPQKPEGIGEADDALFAELENMTAPRFEQVVRVEGHIGCSANRSSQPIGRVVVAETGRAGIYDYTVLAATGTTALGHWLRENHYNVPAGAEPIFANYVRLGWWWLAIRLDAQHTNGAVLAPHPIRYTYHDHRLVYPLIISQLSADESNEVVLYVLSNVSYGCENWANQTIEAEELKVQNGAPSGTNYEQVFQDATRREGGHLFVTEFARNLGDDAFRPLLNELDGEDRRTLYLTRLRAVVPRPSMDRDVILVPRFEHPVYGVRKLKSGRTSMGGADVTAVIGLLLVVFVVFRRRMKRRRFMPPSPTV
jgi:hypothetical protein